jgi:mannitol-1-/sugar-/sorbitol-6-phosphatase
MPQFECSAILFDLDGVLVDSTQSVERLYRVWARENGVDPDYLVRIAHGVRTVEVVKAVAPHLDAEAETLKIEAREAADVEGIYVMPGAVELTASIPEERWGVVTSGRLALATSRLRLAKIPVPQVFVTADVVAKGKPDPEPYLQGAKLMRLNPAECLVIEDAPAGIESGQAAGMRVIAVTSTYPAEKLQTADDVVASLKDIQVGASRPRGPLIVSTL